MEVRLPHEVIYDTPRPVPVADIIDSLQGTLQLSQEIGPILQVLMPGLIIEAITVTVVEISQASPLREAFSMGLVAVYQEKIGAAVPKLIHDLFGVDIPHGYDNLVSLVMIVLIFYSGQLLYNKGSSLIIGRPRIKRQLDGLVSEVATMLHIEEDSVRRALNERYLKGKGGNIQQAALKIPCLSG
jgi:hypothetical protein